MNGQNNTNPKPPAFPPMPRQETAPISHRHAAAFAEIKAIEAAYESLQIRNAELEREIDKVVNQRDLLDAALRQERIDCKVYQRKLIRLATAMSGIGALTAEAEQIMRDVADFDKAAEEIEKLPPEA